MYIAEKDNAYYIDFRFKDNSKNILLHDIRIEHEGKVAQIDHIIINRLGIEVLESKSFTGTLTIKGDGSLNVEYGKQIQTFPNPIEQNNRHAQILADFIKANMELPSNIKLLGIPISSTVLINPKTTITNNSLPKGFNRADSFTTHWDERVDKMSTLSVFKTLGTMMSLDKAKEIADFLIKHHKPKVHDYTKKYPIKKEEKTEETIKKQPTQSFIKKSILKDSPPTNNTNSHTQLCSKCKSSDLEIHYGKYGYYFKCLSCDGNTSIQLTCTTDKCKPQIQKNKLNFYKICKVCDTNELFFKNPEPVLEKTLS